MSEHEVLNAVKDSFDDVTMSTPVERIMAAGSARRNRRRFVGAAGGAAAAALAIGVPALSNPSTAPPSAGNSTGAGSVHIQSAAYTIDTKKDGTLVATWDKSAYFSDHAGLEQALRRAGFPVLIKEGVFCKGPHDDGKLSPSGSGPGVTNVMKGRTDDDGKVTFTFFPAAMPDGKQLFIGYLNAAQLASVHMNPGSVERIVPADGPLTCTTTPPPEHHYN
ncbi:twin-arginine translocation signal domain-containing protein [Actinacidiphila paucisporea]|uniref:Tat (Twin-arginine translocation) pathway signal sequence n=1 Tax=Actinacidiphila paucisporea TaxID=310782 RepID=A0A1M7MPQ3_9ACTN|nr:twin-arginine translocation signal domain-containing protein [Actinacidiphila paucisporea]SHM92966.1 Tat (twin-arginine translocation) pathway signal sequence [Actinacidiphila paucisporea]